MPVEYLPGLMVRMVAILEAGHNMQKEDRYGFAGGGVEGVTREMI